MMRLITCVAIVALVGLMVGPAQAGMVDTFSRLDGPNPNDSVGPAELGAGVWKEWSNGGTADSATIAAQELRMSLINGAVWLTNEIPLPDIHVSANLEFDTTTYVLTGPMASQVARARPGLTA